MLSIRKTNDYDLIYKIAISIFHQDEVDIENHHYWIAADDGKPVAFCSLKELPQENSVFLSLSGVCPRYRKNGLQRKMIKTRCAWAKKHNYKYALTYTTKDNYPSISNLIKSNFKFYDPEYKWAGENMLYFWRPL